MTCAPDAGSSFEGERQLLPVVLEALSFVPSPCPHALLKLQHDEGPPREKSRNEEGGNVYVKGFRLRRAVVMGPVLVPAIADDLLRVCSAG